LDIAKKQDQLVEHVNGTDEWIFLSCLPWINFTAMTNPHGGPDDCIPRITWGKIVERHSKWKMPVSVQAHHALIDGIHMGKFYQALSEAITAFEK
jgi:chloramphenicol O-acetyltransferase type A